jgi:hypothetical protein
VALELELVPAMSVQCRSSRSGGEGGTSRHLAAHPLWIGLGFVGGGVELRQTLCTEPPAPTSVFVAQGDGGPPAKNRLGAPDQGASQGESRWAFYI